MIEQEMYQELTGRDRGMKNTYLTLNRFSRFYLLEMFYLWWHGMDKSSRWRSYWNRISTRYWKWHRLQWPRTNCKRGGQL